MGSKMSVCVKKDHNRVSAELNGDIYHEKQSRELCALHALNNLFQDSKAFSKHDLDSLCYNLSPNSYINPHKSMFGLGNYDVNVVMAALQTKNYDTIWWDKRKNIDSLNVANIRGFILNIPTDYKWGILHLPMQRKHWITIRKICDNYYNLDSKLDSPQLIGRERDLLTHLKEQVECRQKELLLVVLTEVAKNGTWMQKPGKESDKSVTMLDECYEKQMLRKNLEDDYQRQNSLDDRTAQNRCIQNGSPLHSQTSLQQSVNCAENRKNFKYHYQERPVYHDHAEYPDI